MRVSGRKYIPLIEGEIYGFKIGIDTKINLWEHSRELNYDKLKGEYLIGIGVGFTKAQQIRELIKEKNENLLFEEKLELFKFLIDKCGDDYVEFTTLSKEFLKNIDNWGRVEIPSEIIRKTVLLVAKKRLQRALDKINKFNHEEFRLKLIIEYREINSLLPDLRTRKKRGIINTEEYQQEKIRIESKLLDWLKMRENQHTISK
jgi:hypothetical protein